MVGTRNPTSVLALHPGAANQHILNGIVEHVPHVQNPGHVGRWDYYAIRFASVGYGTEKSVVHPVLVPFVFNRCRVIFARNFHVSFIKILRCKCTSKSLKFKVEGLKNNNQDSKFTERLGEIDFNQRIIDFIRRF